ncbi:hypothetical protein BBJ28_00011323, partial [Nothophytophthora sp. Chile5]
MRMTWSLVAACAFLAGVVSEFGPKAPTVAERGPPVVIWYAPFLSGGGYCSEAHSYVVAIASALASPPATAAVDTSATDRDAEQTALDANHPLFSLLVTQHGDSLNPAFIRDTPEDMRTLLEQVPFAVYVGLTMFETDRVPAGWTDRMNKMDEIWVPTKFQEKVFVDGGVRPESIKVVPEVVDVHFFDPKKVDEPYDLASEAAFELTEHTTVYLSIFKWEERKAWRVLLTAYFEAFSPEDDVVLVLLTNGYHS